MTLTRIAFSMIVALLLLALAGQSAAAPKVALVVGNAVYRHAPRLANPLNDAGDVGAALGRLGFEVTRLENADQIALRRGLQVFARAASAAEAAVVFYAGHGIEVGGRNFLVPVDAQLKSDREVEFETVSLELVSRAVEGASGLGLVILDACRDNPFAAAMQRAGSSRSIGRGLARVEPSGEMLVAYAAKGGTVASDGRGRNSPYSAALLRHLEEPGLEVGLLFRKVRDAVLQETKGKQEPFVYGSLSSKGFWLAGRLAAPRPQALDKLPQGGQTGSDRLSAEQLASERLFWESVKDSKDPADIRAYLQRYPRGTYAALAGNKLRRLTAGDPPSPDAGSAPSGGAASSGGGNQTAMLPARPAPAEPSPAKPAPSADPEAAEAALALTAGDRRLIQWGLSAAGFDPGPADGAFGARTRAALKAWQAKAGKAATGHLTLAAASTLKAAGAASAARAKAEANAKAQEAKRKLNESIAKVLSAAKRKETPPLVYLMRYAPRSLEVVEELIARGADVNRADKIGRTPLYVVVYSDHLVKVAKLLIDRGADVNRKNIGGETPLHRAVQNAYSVTMVKLLIDRGADVSAVDKNGQSPLNYVTQSFTRSIKQDHVIEVARLLLDRGANVDGGPFYGNTPLINAVTRGKYKVVKFLIERGADVNICRQTVRNDTYVASALTRATAGGRKKFRTFRKIERLLRNHGAREC